MLAKEVFLFIVLFAISSTETVPNILNNVQLPLQQQAVPFSDEFKDHCVKNGGPAAYLKTQEAGNKYFHCFNEYVMHSLNNSHSDCLYGLIAKYIDVVNNSCSGPADRRDGLEFYHLVSYSTRTGVFQDFINNTGVECIDAVKDKISACVKKELGTKEGLNKTKTYNKYENLWKMTAFYMYPETCQATNRIKLCTQQAMRDEGYSKCKYMNYNVLYVGSIFDYMLERCSRIVPNWTDTSQLLTMNCSDNAHVTHSLLAALLAMVVLAILYMCVRDCRSSRGPWMVIRERIMKMKHRRTLNEDS